jgi:hypothetical protein
VKAASKAEYPEDEFKALDVYRRCWKAKGSYDTGNEMEYEQRFLLVGRPQIGKTGSFLFLIALLWEVYGRKFELPDAEEVVEDDDVPSDDEHDDPRADDRNMGKLPAYSYMLNLPFRDKPSAGKYGDPCDRELRKHYLLPSFPNSPHERAKEKSTAAPASTAHATAMDCSSSGSTAGESIPNTGVMVPHKKKSKSMKRFMHQVCETSKPDVGYIEFQVAGGTLHVPREEYDKGVWWEQKERGAIVLKNRAGSGDACVAIPIFMPTSGRAYCRKCSSSSGTGSCYCAKLDIGSRAMISSGRIKETKANAEAGERLDYVQILIVKGIEFHDYKARCPPRAALFVLPAEVDSDTYPNGVGVGFARYYTKRLAEHLCPHDFRYCFVMDDSVQYMEGVTLRNDPHPCFDLEPGPKAQTSDISLGDVLLWFQLQPDMLKQFGILGFYRRNGFQHDRAYGRTHCTKAIVLNLDKLKDIDYEKGAHLWEDLKFNWDAERVDWQERGAKDAECKSDVISCKFYRFQCGCAKLLGGGCAYLVARADEQPVEVAPPVASPVPPAPPLSAPAPPAPAPAPPVPAPPPPVPANGVPADLRACIENGISALLKKRKADQDEVVDQICACITGDGAPFDGDVKTLTDLKSELRVAQTSPSTRDQILNGLVAEVNIDWFNLRRANHLLRYIEGGN